LIKQLAKGQIATSDLGLASLFLWCRIEVVNRPKGGGRYEQKEKGERDAGEGPSAVDALLSENYKEQEKVHPEDQA
jgi:hypothetical protein